MSRIGKKPVAVLDGVKVAIQGRIISVEGPQGKLSWEHRPEVSVAYDDKSRLVNVNRGGDDRMSRALHGLTRALIQNMIEGVKKGYEKRLEVIGVGAPRLAPAFLEHAPGRVVEYLLGCAPRAGILAHRLLGEDGGNARAPDCLDMARRCQSKAIAHSCRRTQRQRRGL